MCIFILFFLWKTGHIPFTPTYAHSRPFVSAALFHRRPRGFYIKGLRSNVGRSEHFSYFVDVRVLSARGWLCSALAAGSQKYWEWQISIVPVGWHGRFVSISFNAVRGRLACTFFKHYTIMEAFGRRSLCGVIDG